MTLSAIISCPSSTRNDVFLRYVDSDGRAIPHTPTITIPCASYEHARAVVEAYNSETVTH